MLELGQANSTQESGGGGDTTRLFGRPLRLLMVEDSELDAEILVVYLKKSGFDVQYKRVEDTSKMDSLLAEENWDLVLCDYSLPGFGVGPALNLLKQKKLDLPFIVVSGAVGEKLAVEVMKAGAHDFILKDSLVRLAPAIERELREAKARRERAAAMEKLVYLAAIVDSTDEAIIGQNMEGTITTWNTGAWQLFGFSETEAVGRSISLIMPEEGEPKLPEILETVRAGKSIDRVETVRRRKDGAMLDVCVTVSPIRDATGRILGASSIAYDITERKRIEDERTRMIDQLNDTLSKVRTLSGLLPICAACKKIRDDHGYWQKLETFVREHSNAEFSHSICPDCMENLYPEFAKRK